MKIAVLADIHANFRALETVIDHVERWKPDVVVVAGDIVNRGPRSFCCLERIEEKRKTAGWYVIKGNHEDYVIERDQPNDARSGPMYDLIQPAYFTYRQLHQDVSILRGLPRQITLKSEEDDEIRILHASMLGNRDGIYPENTDAQIERKISPLPAVFITGHTHRTLIRRINNTLVVNAGSVGLPFDGDTRAAYAQITHSNGEWRSKIIRLLYNVGLTEKDYDEFGFANCGGPIVNIIRLELQTGIGQLYQWVAKYNDPIKNGEISVAKATEEFLKNPVKKPYW